jgi:hypothetical protein
MRAGATTNIAARKSLFIRITFCAAPLAAKWALAGSVNHDSGEASESSRELLLELSNA